MGAPVCHVAGVIDTDRHCHGGSSNQRNPSLSGRNGCLDYAGAIARTSPSDRRIRIGNTHALSRQLDQASGVDRAGGLLVEIRYARIPVVHAFVAQVFFALVVAIAVLASKSWQSEPERVESQWKPLRFLGMALPFFVFLQIGLGAAFRHNSMSVIWHILDAMIVLLVILVTGVFVLRQYPEHPTLHPAALALVILTGVQVMLGFTVYMALLISSGNNTGLIITSVLHVVNGSLTLAASVALAMRMQRNLIQLSGA